MFVWVCVCLCVLSCVWVGVLLHMCICMYVYSYSVWVFGMCVCLTVTVCVCVCVFVGVMKSFLSPRCINSIRSVSPKRPTKIEILIILWRRNVLFFCRRNVRSPKRPIAETSRRRNGGRRNGVAEWASPKRRRRNVPFREIVLCLYCNPHHQLCHTHT